MDQRDISEIGVLGLFNEWEALTLETIHERLEHNFGAYWTYSYGVLVPTVSRLQEDGSVTIASGLDDTFPGEADGSQAFAITDTGRKRLQELLQRPVAALDDPTERHKLMIKLGFIHHLPPADRAGELDALIDRFYGFRQEWTEALEAHDEATMAPFEAHGYRVKLVELSIEILDTIIGWLEEIRSDTLPASAPP